jgi:hypothetical protein
MLLSPQSWINLEDQLAEFYAWAAPKNKPLSFPEFGSNEVIEINCQGYSVAKYCSIRTLLI